MNGLLRPGLLGANVGMANTGHTAHTKYYVNATGGNDGNDGLRPNRAWQTIAKVNAATFSAGNRILLKRGETWDGTILTPPDSGTGGKRIISDAYGTGALPIVQAPLELRSMLIASKNYLTFSNIHFRYGTSQVVSIQPAGNDIIFSNCTIEGDTGEKANGIALWGAAADIYNLTIRNCTVFNNQVLAGGGAGIVLGNPAAAVGPSNILIEDCAIYDNGTTSLDHGIYITASDSVTIRGCDIYGNFGRGVTVADDNARTVVVEKNSIRDNNIGVGPINHDSANGTITIRNNLIYSNVRGIWHTGNPLDCVIYHNTIVNNTDTIGGGGGLRFSNAGSSAGLTIKNNLIVQDITVVISNVEYPVWITDTDVLVNNTFDNNLYYYPGQSLGRIGLAGGSGQTFTQWQALTGTPDPNGVNDDPDFVIEFTDFHLLATSPARGAGEADLVDDDYDDVIRTTDDMGAYEYVA